MSCRVNEWKGRRKKNNKFEWCQNAKDVDGRTDGRSMTGLSFFFSPLRLIFFLLFSFLKNIFERICKRERERKIHREKLTWNREILSINATLEWFPFRPSVMMSPFFFFYFLLGKKEKEKKGRLDYPAYNTVFLPAGFSSFYFIFFSSASSSSCCV
jgi:hypothetical protein